VPTRGSGGTSHVAAAAPGAAAGAALHSPTGHRCGRWTGCDGGEGPSHSCFSSEISSKAGRITASVASRCCYTRRQSIGSWRQRERLAEGGGEAEGGGG
jgi:hypothetical protein